MLFRSGVIIHHSGYSFEYSEKHEQARWVAYQLTASETHPIVGRSNHFIPDDHVATGTATESDYKGSGYDRGHLAPAADMEWSETAMRESFYFSNMSPQVKGFNEGIWKKLEEQVRDWAALYDTLYVVTAGVLNDSLRNIGPHHV